MTSMSNMPNIARQEISVSSCHKTPSLERPIYLRKGPPKANLSADLGQYLFASRGCAGPTPMSDRAHRKILSQYHS